MKLSLTVIFSILLTVSYNGRAQYNFGVLMEGGSENFYDVIFLSESVGYVCGSSGTILKTTCGGAIWEDKSVGDGFMDLYAIEFIDENTGWACGTMGRVYLTVNGGDSWNYTNPEPSTDIVYKGISFVNANLGWVVGTDPIGDNLEVIHYTTDGGWSWSAIDYNGFAGTYYDVQFNSGTTLGWACGTDGNVLYSVNGGADWMAGSGTNSLLTYKNICMATNTVGLAGGDNSEILLTTDGGITWSYIVGGVPGTLVNDIDAYAPDVVAIAVGTLGYAYSDGFLSWTSPTNPTTAILEGVDIINSTTAFIVGHSGTILKSPVPGSTDVVITGYLSPDTICGTGLVPINVELKNIGDQIVNLVSYSVWEGSTMLLSGEWTGSLLPTETTNVQLGHIPFTASISMSIQIGGDTVLTNNTFAKDIVWLGDVGMGVESPVTVCIGDSVSLDAYGGTSYLWYEFLGGPQASVPNPWVKTAETMNYFVEITSNLCFGVYEVEVMVDPCGATQISNVISPNGDGVNDFFFVENLNSSDSTAVTIFGRWGEILFNVSGYDNGNPEKRWEGTHNGQQTVLSGTYFYAITPAGAKPKTGWIQVVR